MDIPVALGLSGCLLMVVAWIWLTLQIMRGRPVLALVALVVPFFHLYYIWQNWDIAWRPTALYVLGLVLFFTAHALD